LLKGKLLGDSADGALIVDVSGVGYEVLAPLGTAGRLAPDPDGRVTLHIHTHVREDALQLFGFATLDERSAFRALLGVSKIGPKIALALLGALTVAELARAVGAGEAPLLAKVPGIGKRTAERLVLELEGKLAFSPVPLAGAPTAPGRPPTPGSRAAMAQVEATLVRMGFRQVEAERAVAALEGREAPLEELLREALALLSP
jgi:Holliday junction DNA helicase RuvA